MFSVSILFFKREAKKRRDGEKDLRSCAGNVTEHTAAAHGGGLGLLAGRLSVGSGSVRSGTGLLLVGRVGGSAGGHRGARRGAAGRSLARHIICVCCGWCVEGVRGEARCLDVEEIVCC